jgi:hypothetical protein
MQHIHTEAIHSYFLIVVVQSQPWYGVVTHDTGCVLHDEAREAMMGMIAGLNSN